MSKDSEDLKRFIESKGWSLDDLYNNAAAIRLQAISNNLRVVTEELRKPETEKRGAGEGATEELTADSPIDSICRGMNEESLQLFLWNLNAIVEKLGFEVRKAGMLLKPD
jgi:hypothetical protein